MSLWRLLSYLPGTRAHRIYRDTVRFAEDVRQFAIFTGDDVHESAFEPVPPILRDRAACVVVVEAMLALLEALKGNLRGLELAESEAILAEHLPTLEEMES